MPLELFRQGEAKAELFTDLFADVETDVLIRDIPWQQNRIQVYGKIYDEPRLTAWFGPPYKYASVSWPEAPLPQQLRNIQQRLIELTSFPFNAVLLNFYRNGDDAMGWHRDNEKEIDQRLIASVSFGATRTFKIRAYKGDFKTDVDLTHGSLLLMQNMQSNFEHSLPRRKRVDGPRINLTFRRIIS